MTEDEERQADEVNIAFHMGAEWQKKQSDGAILAMKERIKELRATLSDIIWDCPHDGPEDWCGDDYCPCKQAFEALEKEDE
jgi:hypothetical protein